LQGDRPAGGRRRGRTTALLRVPHDYADVWSAFLSPCAPCSTSARRRTSHVEPEEQDVTVLHYVLTPFRTHQTGITRRGLRTEPIIVVKSDRFSANKPFLKVTVNLAGSLRSARAAADRPRTRLLRPGREERDESEQLVRGTDKPVKTRVL